MTVLKQKVEKTPPLEEVSRDDSYVPPKLVSRELVLGIGAFVYLLATIWPPLVLVFSYFVWTVVGYSYRLNDDATTRRMLLDEFDKNDKVSDHLRAVPDDVDVQHSYWTNPRGMLLHTTTITPKNQPVKAVVCHCHGYAENACYTKLAIFCTLAQKGIAVLMLAYEGHARSDGDLVLIRDFDVLTEDVVTYYGQKTKELFPGIRVFLFGESMGGAVAYNVYRHSPSLFSGIVFLSPMCKIADNMLPPQWVIDTVRMMCGPKGTVSPLGYLPIAPSRGDLKNLSFKLATKKALFTRTPSIYGRNPRLATARELLDITKRISGSLEDFDAPFIVLHGKMDRVTDPKLSQMLYDESKSKDKTIKLYDGMWHMMLNGEPDDNCEIVFNDAVNWILERAVDQQRKDQ